MPNRPDDPGGWAVKVEVTFPIRTEGPTRRAASLAAADPSYRSYAPDVSESPNSPNGSGLPEAAVEIGLPEGWGELDQLMELLRGEAAGYAVDGEEVPVEELREGLRCFFRKQRAGLPEEEWCTPPGLAGRQMFGCKQIHVYDNEHATKNSWYTFGEMGADGVFRVDRERITDRVLTDLGPCAHCPILDLDAVAETIARLPETIDPNRDEGWRYRGGGDVSGWSVAKDTKDTRGTRENSAPEPRRDGAGGESLVERFARNLRGAPAAAPGGGAGTRNVPDTRYEDVGGMDEAITLIREAVELPVTNPALFERLGIKPHRGVLLHGPPGTGKTLLARAVARETGAHFIAVSGPEILNKYWGQSEARLRNIFAEAKNRSPAIILFDELDSFASARDSASESFEATLVSQLLSLMDGLSELGRVCVVATTNRPSSVDPALRRPGRFDHEVRVGLPDEAGRTNILRIHSRRMPLAPGMNLEDVARSIGGYSGADIEALCREAAMACLRRSVDLKDVSRPVSAADVDGLTVTEYDFRNAMKRIVPTARR
ncbi:ATP-binding protein [Rubrobacter aplysinae]|uniref:ATP-binding protein n=1 Tax=Rubrobacter aplysinae TaxID=909625 RepID=UPI00069ED137|nr:AAA family ATPase [Rubrobacter aplysinae]